MTRLFDREQDFGSDALDGFVLANRRYVDRVDGGVVRTTRASSARVGVVVGGGAGHYPAFAGLVGEGLATGAVCGNVFTSPSAGQAYRVARSAEDGRGVLFSYGNYAGDRLHFGLAQDRLRSEGIDARTVVCTDDIASAPIDERRTRRGIAGALAVFKIAGAAAERGMDLYEVERLARAANERTFTLGVAFEGCTLPGESAPLFTVPAGMMSIGLGIHGEPGISEQPMASADGLAELLLDRLLAERPCDAGDRLAVIVNGLGSVKYEELFVLYKYVVSRLEAENVTIVEPECGEFVTSLDMAGASVTLFWLTDELEALWCDPADAPAYRKGTLPTGALKPRTRMTQPLGLPDRLDGSDRPEVCAVSQKDLDRNRFLVAAIRGVQRTLRAHREELGRIDAIAGDGDHGSGMVRGIEAVARAVLDGQRSAGPAALLHDGGDAWAEEAGGTSGALWGAALRAMGDVLAEGDAPAASTDSQRIVAAMAEAALHAIVRLGGAQRGQKTMVDAIAPYVETLRDALDRGSRSAEALLWAAAAAESAAAATSQLRPMLGRARPLAERSIGHPDAGAVSFALIARSIAETAEQEETMTRARWTYPDAVSASTEKEAIITEFEGSDRL